MVGSFVDKRVIFEDFIKNIKSERMAKRFSNDNQFYPKLKIKRRARIGEDTDSVMVSIDIKKPEITKQRLDGFLSFSAS
ncbi:hypothetical protein [Abyssogena phaseoliformis symbiont]|uniref:hypothetical protein n=1 Tax=Abyssogena phaseoliformis symbiont TaxID=596095 RepID=UPI0019166859|nr:hypothetical protein [Abyssogena phaseoliformis symbiont]MBW5288687.1 hypothetical protein [Candidatus Ruthia sp. Apha_13_S6]